MVELRNLGVGVSIAAGLVLLGACKDDPPVNAFIDEYCGSLTTCCAPKKPGEEGGAPGSGCKSFYSFFGGSSYVEAKGDACLAEIRANRADPTFCSRVSQLAPSCGQAFASNTGSKPLGAECNTSRECAPSNEGKVECNFGAGNASICKLELPGKEGDTPCAQTRNGAITQGSSAGEVRSYVCDLAAGLYCNLTSRACERTKAVGEACTSTGSSFMCGADGSCSSGKCAAKTPSSSGSGTSPFNDPSLLFVCSSTD